MTASSKSWGERILRGVTIIGWLLAYIGLIFVFTVLIASPLMMLRTTMLVPGAGPEESELGRIAGAAAAVLATMAVMHLFHGARLRDVGLNWSAADRRNLWLGLAGGVGGGIIVTALPVLSGAAEMRVVEKSTADLHNLVYYLAVIAIGSAGEEIQVRGFLFQTLARSLGWIASILLTAALFAAAHLPNPNASLAAVANTFLFGAALGYAMWRSGSLWLPIGLHAGWNLMLPLFGANLSGFSYRLTKYEMDWKIGPTWSGGAYGPEGGLIGTIALLAWIYWVYRAPIVRQDAFLLKERDEELVSPGDSIRYSVDS